jgi:hypothetical protein
MKKFVGFPSIEQFRNVIREVKLNTDYKGKGEDGKAIYRSEGLYPQITFTGTIKVHGTSAAVCFDGTEMWCQSRSNIIDPLKDNAGFACWVHSKRELFDALMRKMHSHLRMEKGDVLAVYGEWAGGNIQKGVAVTGLEKFFAVFGVRVIRGEEYQWVAPDFWDPIIGHCDYFASHRLFSIFDFPHFRVSIDFNAPEDVQNFLGEKTLAVEAECPVGKYFGATGIGEGIVYTAYRDNGQQYCFKVKGALHSNSKVKVLAAVDTEKVANVKAMADKVCTENRMQQGRDWIINQEGVDASRPENLGTFLKWLNGDIFKEEMDTIVDSGLTPKEVSKEVNRIGREFYFANM